MATITKTFTRKTADRRFIVATAEFRIGDPRGISDGFAITGEVYEPHGTWSGEARYRNGREADAGGCVHEEILSAFPELAPVVAVHLADPNGVPVHANANGWYFYSGDARRWEETRGDTWSNRDGLSDRERAARALHVDVADVPEGLDASEFADFVESLRPRWAGQAATARAILQGV